MATVIPLSVRVTPPMKTVTQRAFVVVSERIKPFSPQLEPLSMKLANSVCLTIAQLARSLPDIAVCLRERSVLAKG